MCIKGVLLLDHTDANTNIEYLVSQVREFLQERDWQKYHNPKDLAESICIEAAELLQLFQWISLFYSMRDPFEKKEGIKVVYNRPDGHQPSINQGER